jgi:DnaJ like chaperone protein
MSWWGKLIGGTFGFMIGGPLGAVLGAALGHNFDQGRERLPGEATPYQSRHERIQTAFFTASFSVMGHVCKADGQVTRDEISVARQVMAHMELNPDQKQAAIALFNEGKKGNFPLDDVLIQLRKEIGHRLTLKRMFMEIQCLAAVADKAIHPGEKRLLLHICEVIGFNQYELESLLSSVSVGLHRQDPAQTMGDAYKVLGIPRSASDQEVKKAYRRLMNQHHPDKLVAKGLPEEMIKLASDRTHEIKTAYEQIKQQRGL